MFRSIWKFYLEYAPFISHVHPDFAVERALLSNKFIFQREEMGKKMELSASSISHHSKKSEKILRIF